MGNPLKSLDDLIRRLGKGAGVPPPSAPPQRSMLRPPPPAPPRGAVAQADQTIGALPRFASEHEYLREWNQFMDAGIPNEYRTYGASYLGTDPAVREVASVLEGVRGKGASIGQNQYFGNFVQTPRAQYEIVPGTFGTASQRANSAGDREEFLQVYGRDPDGRPAILYSIPSEVARQAGLARRLEAMGYSQGLEFRRK